MRQSPSARRFVHVLKSLSVRLDSLETFFGRQNQSRWRVFVDEFFYEAKFLLHIRVNV